MDQIIRFYWHGCLADLPLEAIPDADRNPLRVRRSVLQQHFPEVVQQLKDGRFVAAAWKSTGHISVIVCHPNLAKGDFDTIVVNTPSLPEVVMKVEQWEQVPEAARLFLVAFGGEAANIDECVAARRSLATWLIAHNQAETANSVKRYSNFPFGVKSDPLDVVNIWRRVVVTGEKEKVDNFVEEVKRRFDGLGWLRDTVFESRLNSTPEQFQHFYCWASSSTNKPHFMLSLKRSAEIRMRGGPINIRDDKASIADLASVIQHVFEAVLEPSAKTAGLKVSYPRIGPISRIGVHTEQVMTAFVEYGDGKWPLSEHLEGMWRIIVLTAKGDNSAIDPKELMAWFTANGWDDDASRALVKRFYSDSALLEEYEQERQPA
jgi:hypothetical protein